MNKVETAIRITHLPTGIVVQCQNERSQLQNRNGAMKILKSRLYELELKKKEAVFNAIVGEKKDIAWGSQIRSYVFQPYQMVKDHRTGYEVGQVAAVMDGDLDGFIEAYLKMKQLGITSLSYRSGTDEFDPDRGKKIGKGISLGRTEANNSSASRSSTPCVKRAWHPTAHDSK